MHTWPLNTPCGFKHRFVVENKDRFLEGRHFYDEWDKACRARGVTKQQRVLYRQREDYKTSLGAFLWELDEDLHSDNFVGNFASWWLKEFPKNEPLFMQIGFPGPHPPYDPLPEFSEKYMGKDLSMQELSQKDIDAQPKPYKNLMSHNAGVDHDSVVHLMSPTQEQRHKQRAYYCANVSMIDQKIGEIMQTLEEQGYLENSIVVFTSDHGDCLTDHGHTQKWTMYEQVNRVPCVVWSPKYFKGGRSVDGLIQQMDLAPMLLKMAGAEVPESLEAVSVEPMLQGEVDKIRDHVYCEQGRDDHFETCDFMTMIRDDRYKLTHFVDREDGLLFDLKQDPEEMNNLWDDENYLGIKNKLIQKICHWRISSGYHTRRQNDEWR
jgi:arylsulfatase A-like enzyme